MCVLEIIKLLAEIITTLATAFVVITNMFKFCDPTIKGFFKITVPLFFKGYTNPDGTKTRFLKGLKLQREDNKNITEAILKNFDMEDVLVLDKNALLDIISKSSAFYTIRQRRKKR
ncbi:MAG: hypothetical protein LBV17_02595 [Treponema sp.]|jgi:hypothetical protein|nr:hypothetical protein [Treponema sp.]